MTDGVSGRLAATPPLSAPDPNAAHSWSESYGQIYLVLNALVRSVEPQPSRNELLLKLLFGRFVPEDEPRRVMSEVRDRRTADVSQWAAIEDQLRSPVAKGTELDRRDRLQTLRYGRLVGEATCRWAEEVLAEPPAGPEPPAEPKPPTTAM